MQTFSVVAVRLIGLWLIAGASGYLVIFAASFLPSAPTPVGWGVQAYINLSATLAPIAAGLVLLVWSRPIARLVVAGVAEGAPSPEPLTIRGFTQVGVFLLGLFTILNGLPMLIGALVGGWPVGPQQWVYIGLGALLIFSCVNLGKLIEALRR